MTNLRPYQTESLGLIRGEFKKGSKKVLLWLATGAGKTVIFCDMIKAADKNNKKAIVVVRGRKLVDQCSVRLMRENVEHGVMMSGHWNYRPSCRVQICSIDTLIARNLRPQADLIIIDEAHMAASDGYKKFLADYNTYLVSVTATPWVEKGLRHVADSIVHPITMLQLIEQGYLVPFRYFAPSSPDLSGVKISSSTKDYVKNQLESAMVKGQLTGKIIDHWQKIASDRKTILFAVNIHHSELLAEKFNAAGIRAEHCDANTTDRDREKIINRFKSGETKVICNVGIFCIGVDIPPIGAIIMARPTKSRNLFIQQAGRGTRVVDGKSNCILLDHAGNIKEHDLPTDEPEVDLDGEMKTSHKRESKICKECFCVYRGDECPECGTVPPTPPKREILESDEQLKELNGLSPMRQYFKELEKMRKSRGYKKGWSYYKLLEKFTMDECLEILPDWFIAKYESPALFSKSPFKSI